MRSPIISGLDFEDSDATDSTASPDGAGHKAGGETPYEGFPTERSDPPPPRERRLSSAEIRASFKALDIRLRAIEKAVPTTWEKRAALTFGGIIAAAMTALAEHYTGIKIGGSILEWIFP